MNIINENNLLKEIRRIVKEEIIKKIPNNQVEALWKYLNKLDEKIKCLEKNN
jgi:hypothetical protein